MALEFGLQFDHVAVTVPDLDASIEWYCATFGFPVAWREDWTDAPAASLGLPGETVRLRGAGLDTGTGVYLELHEMLPPVFLSDRARSTLRPAVWPVSGGSTQRIRGG